MRRAIAKDIASDMGGIGHNSCGIRYGYGYPGPQAGIDIEDKGFTGGVGYETAMGGGNGGGGGGGSAFIVNSGGASDEPPNGGGVNTPAGYGPTYRGVWQGPTLPSRGGLATSSPSTTGTTSK